MQKIDRSIFKKRLFEALKNKKMKSVDLCRETRICKSLVSQYLSGRASPTAYKLLVIARVLNVSPYWLVGMDEVFKERSDSDE